MHQVLQLTLDPPLHDLQTILVVSYLFGYSFYYNNDNYAVLITSFRKNRLPYLYTKILTLSLIVIIFNAIIYILYLLIGIIGNRYFTFQTYILNIFIQSILINLIYGYLTSILIMFIKSYFVILIPYLLFIVSEILGDYQSLFVELYHLLLPTIINNNSNNQYVLLCLLFIYYLIIFTFCYQKHEI